MRCLVPILVAMVLAGCVAPGERPRFAPDPIALPEYDSDRFIGYASSRSDYDAAHADSRYEMRQFVYRSDGLEVGAYLYRPRARQPKRAPVIVFNRGSVVRTHGFAGEMLVMAHRYAEAGFIVIAPHYRGSLGWQGRDELGGAELHDLMNLVRVLPHLEGVDASRLFLAGESRGGAMVYMALRDGFPARAAAVWGAFTDLGPLFAPGSPQANAGQDIWPDFATRREEIIRTRSALQWADRIDVPILVMHGGADQDIPLSQSQRMDGELTRLGKTHKLVVFEGEQHVIGGRGAERDAASIAWFRQFDAGRDD